MSKLPMGKTLLRNVIRHTDAHNKVHLSLCVTTLVDYGLSGASI